MSQNYSGNAVADVLDASMTNSQDTATIADGTGWPTSNFVATIHRGEVNEEQIYVATRSGTALSGITRGYAGTTAYAHDANEAIEHTADAVSMQRWEDHIADTVDAHDATAISFSPTGTIAGTTVQAAIAEVSGDVSTLDAATTSALAGKASSSHTHTTSDVTSLAEFIRDTMATALVQGTGITLTVDDPGDTITIAASADITAQLLELPQGLLDYVEITTDFSTVTTTAVDVTDLAVTISTDGTRRIRVEIGAGFTERATLLIREGSTILARLSGASWGSTPSSPDRVAALGTRAVILTPTAGNHTYKFSVDNFTNTGTVTVYCDTDNPAYILAEDIGPA